MKKSDNGIKNLAAALAKFQEEVSNPANTATNPQFRSKYAPLEVVINTVKPFLAKNGLSYVQSTGAEDESILVTTLLIHESGEWIESDPLKLPAYQLRSGGGKEFNAQGAGSSITYARRYSLSAILGLSSEDDDDANAQASGGASSGKGNSSKPSSPAKSTPTSDTSARERLIAEAKEKAEANKKAKAEADAKTEAQVETKVEDSSPVEVKEDELPFSLNEPAEESIPLIADALIKAIGNMTIVVAKKKGNAFSSEKFLSDFVAKFGKANIKELTQPQGKEISDALNALMREK